MLQQFIHILLAAPVAAVQPCPPVEHTPAADVQHEPEADAELLDPATADLVVGMPRVERRVGDKDAKVDVDVLDGNKARREPYCR